MAEEINLITTKYLLEIDAYIKNLNEVKKQLGLAGKAGEDANKKIKGGFEESEESASAFSGILGDVIDQTPALGEIKSQMVGASEGFLKTSKSVLTMVKSLGVLKTAIIATGLGALAVALGSIIAYFKGTDEGATKLESTLTGAGKAVEVLTGQLISWGGSIVDWFNSSAESTDGFVNKTGQAIKAVGGFLYDYVPIIKTVADATVKAFGETADAMGEAFEAGKALSRELSDVASAQRDLSIVNTEAEQRINVLNKSLKNATLTLEERKKIIAELEVLEKKRFESSQKLAIQEYKARYQLYLLTLKADNVDNKIAQGQIDAIAENVRNAESVEDIVKQYKLLATILPQIEQVGGDVPKQMADGLNGLIKLEGEALVVGERIKTLNDNSAQQEKQRQKDLITQQTQQAQTKAINTIADEKALNEELYNIAIASLEKQRALQVRYGEKTAEIDLQIAVAKREHSEGLVQIKEDELKALREVDQRAIAENIKADQQATKELSAEWSKRENEFKQQFVDGTIKNEKELNKILLSEQIKFLEDNKALYVLYGADEIAFDKMLLDLKIKNMKKEVEATKGKTDAQKELEKASIDTTALALNALNESLSASDRRRVEDQQESLAKQASFEDERLKDQLDKKLISEQQYIQAKGILDEQVRQKNLALRRKQAKIEKDEALFSIAINTAVAVAKVLGQTGIFASIAIPAILIAGGIQAALVSARPLPSFKDGVIDFKGKGSGTSDDNLAYISNGESIIKARQTAKHKEALTAINDDKFESYLRGKNVSAILAETERKRSKENEEQASLSRRYMKQYLANGGADLSGLEEVTRRNKNVSIKNADEIGKAIAKNLKSWGNYGL